MARHSDGRSSAGAVTLVVGLAVVAAVITLVMALVTARGRPDPPAASGVGAETVAASPTSGTPSPRVPPPGSSTPTTPDGVTLAFAGDVHFTGRTAPLLQDPADAFGPIADTLSAADVAMVNLETAITEGGVEEPKEFHFRAPATALAALAAAGVDVASMANNHAVDYGPTGLADTLAAITGSDLRVVGVGSDAAAAYAPYRTVVRGTGISIFAVSQIQDRTYAAWSATVSSPGIASTADRGRLIDGVAAATAAGDVVIVYVHWGIEGDPCPTGEMASLATDLAAAGADAVVGTHAHLLLGAGFLEPGGAYVAYGLGNFLWWRANASSDDTGVLTLTVADGSVQRAEFTPALIDDDGRPQPVLGPAAAGKRAAFSALRDCTDLIG